MFYPLYKRLLDKPGLCQDKIQLFFLDIFGLFSENIIKELIEYRRKLVSYLTVQETESSPARVLHGTV